MITNMGLGRGGLGPGLGQLLQTAGGRISLSYLELMYKMKWRVITDPLQSGKMLEMFEGNQQDPP